METGELLFFDPMPQVLPLYMALREQVLARWPETRLKVGKTQISFYDRRLFAMASLPLRRRKGWPAACLVVSFGLGYHREDPRIAAAVEPYPGRWTHHVLVERPEEIDGALLDWLAEARQFALTK